MELRDYLRGLRRHWLAIALMTLLGVGTAYGWSLLQTPVYEATASGLVQAKTAYDDGQLFSDDSSARVKVPTLLEMAGWKEVAEGAIEELGLTGSPESVATQITVENPDGTAIIRFTARANTPQEAAALAQAWIDSLAATVRSRDGDDSPTEISIYSANSSHGVEHAGFPRHSHCPHRRRRARPRCRHRIRPDPQRVGSARQGDG